MSVKYVNPEGYLPPAAQYSQVSIADRGRLAFLSAQGAMDESGVLVSDDIGVQFAQVFRNIVALLDQIGATPADILNLTTYVVGEGSISAFQAARKPVYQQHFGDGPFPPSTLVVVSALPAQLKIEVAATVLLRD